MGLFDANLRTVKKLFEHSWRELARLAAENGYLYAPRARLAIRLTLWVYPKGSRTADRSWSSTKVIELKRGREPKERRKGKAVSAWQRLVSHEEG